MRRLNSKHLSVGLFIVQTLFSQSIFTSDTLWLNKDESQYSLRNNFIFQESVNIIVEGESIWPDSIDYINGIIYWGNTYISPVGAIVRYKALDKDIPKKIGPLWKNLPALDLILKKDLVTENYFQIRETVQDDGLYTSGMFNRQINFSTNGMSEFSGGLNLNISGELENNIMLSAVLSDQDMVIQPEGNTRNLEDIEQVYITMQHPNFSLDAGDIKYKNKTDKLINIERNVIGINNNFKYKNFSGSALLSSTRGKYMSLDVVGLDGVQGPYGLTSKENNKDISLISGSEKVWLDGERLVRGANYDYVIDYSLAEITFTAKHLIHFDSDIFVEYEYVDGLYTQKIISGTYRSDFSDDLNIVTGFIREKDNTNDLSSDSELYQRIINGDTKDLIISGAVEDSTGDYYLDGDIYKYDPDRTASGFNRYRIAFTYNVRGNYEKLISVSGRVYYQYYEGDSPVNKDLYSPNQKISAPGSKDLYYAKGRYRLGNKLTVSTLFSRSISDNNILSGADESERGGMYEVSLVLDSIEAGRMTYSFSADNLIREKKYSSFGLDRNVQYKRYWNLDSIGVMDERESSMKFFMGVDNFSQSSIKYSGLSIGTIKKEKIKLDHKINSGTLSGTNLEHQQVSSDIGTYKYTDANITSKLGYFRPFFRFREERKPHSLSYNILGGGVNYQKENRSIRVGIDSRKDIVNAKVINDAEGQYSEDLISSFQYVNQSRIGWRNNLIFKKRIKRYDNASGDLDYVLGRIKLSYKRPDRPIYFELNTSTERTQNENYSIVYDSVGVGLGNYRYDNSFNTFIRDPNGSYISYSVPSGQRIDMVNVKGFQKIVYDFQKIKGYPALKLKMDTNYDYSGTNFDLRWFANPIISDTSLYRSYLYNIVEIDWSLNKSMKRFRAYNIFSYDLQGYDPRGNELLKHIESGADYYSSIGKNTNVKVTGFYHDKKINSGFTSLRNRNIFGSWYEVSIYSKNRRNLDSEISMEFGSDMGTVYVDDFNAVGLGFEYNGRLYLGQYGSIQTNIAWHKNKEKSGIRVLPPEAINGLTIGENINVNTRANYFLKRDISFSLSISYINNYRYSNLITVLGEFRAYL